MNTPAPTMSTPTNDTAPQWAVEAAKEIYTVCKSYYAQQAIELGAAIIARHAPQGLLLPSGVKDMPASAYLPDPDDQPTAPIAQPAAEPKTLAEELGESLREAAAELEYSTKTHVRRKEPHPTPAEPAATGTPEYTAKDQLRDLMADNDQLQRELAEARASDALALQRIRSLELQRYDLRAQLTARDGVIAELRGLLEEAAGLLEFMPMEYVHKDTGNPIEYSPDGALAKIRARLATPTAGGKEDKQS